MQKQCHGCGKIITGYGTGVVLIQKLNVTTSLIILLNRSITGYATIKTCLLLTWLISLKTSSCNYGLREEILHISFLKVGYFQLLWFSLRPILEDWGT
jgi:hypothetical protein